jgi:hypothetical protein
MVLVVVVVVVRRTETGEMKAADKGDGCDGLSRERGAASDRTVIPKRHDSDQLSRQYRTWLFMSPVALLSCRRACDYKWLTVTCLPRVSGASAPQEDHLQGGSKPLPHNPQCNDRIFDAYK